MHLIAQLQMLELLLQRIPHYMGPQHPVARACPHRSCKLCSGAYLSHSSSNTAQCISCTAACHCVVVAVQLHHTHTKASLDSLSGSDGRWLSLQCKAHSLTHKVLTCIAAVQGDGVQSTSCCLLCMYIGECVSYSYNNMAATVFVQDKCKHVVAAGRLY